MTLVIVDYFLVTIFTNILLYGTVGVNLWV